MNSGIAEFNGTPATVSQLQALALTNYGHFTSMDVVEHGVRGLSLHLSRLEHDCSALFGIPLNQQRIRRLIKQAVPNSAEPITVRVTVFDPALPLGKPSKNGEPGILITTRPAVPQLPPMRTVTAAYRRDMPAIKHVGLFGTLQHRRTAQQNGADDVLFVDGNGDISEGATWNVGFFDGSNIVWPQADCLPGVTMRLLQTAWPNTVVRPIHLDELPEMRAAFATNASIGVREINAIDETTWPAEQTIINELQDCYRAIPTEQL